MSKTKIKKSKADADNGKAVYVPKTVPLLDAAEPSPVALRFWFFESSAPLEDDTYAAWMPKWREDPWYELICAPDRIVLVPVRQVPDTRLGQLFISTAAQYLIALKRLRHTFERSYYLNTKAPLRVQASIEELPGFLDAFELGRDIAMYEDFLYALFRVMYPWAKDLNHFLECGGVRPADVPAQVEELKRRLSRYEDVETGERHEL